MLLPGRLDTPGTGTGTGTGTGMVAVVLLVVLRTFLQTGLFIVAHDAMHGSLCRASSALNHGIGRLALFLYACLPYGSSRRQHLRHHRQPGRSGDPDFHHGMGRHALGWYAGFMGRYLSLPQLATLLGLWVGAAVLLGWADATTWWRIAAYWMLPLVLSSLQLFLFGTYLPHRQPEGVDSTKQRHVVTSSELPPLLSLLTCYYFGYHREHHDHPHVPWYQLPLLRSGHRER